MVSRFRRYGFVFGLALGVSLITAWAVSARPASGKMVITPGFNTGHAPVIGTVPVTAVFTNTTVGAATSFTWDFGDGSNLTVNDMNPVSHTYTLAGVYNVSLTAQDSNGQQYTNSQINNVIVRPTGPKYFNDVTAASGTTAVHQIGVENKMAMIGSGVAWCDVNGDRNMDLFASNNGGANWLFINSGPPNYTFTDEAAARGVDDPQGLSSGSVCVDYDNDGDKDLFVQNFVPSWAPTLPKSRLFRNDGTGHFTDVALASGIDEGRNGQSSAWGDYDKDGRLDVYLVNHTDADCACKPITIDGAMDQLYHQNSDHTFTKVTNLLNPVTSLYGTGFQATWTDYDYDGDLDLYVANDRFRGGPPNRNVLWRNDGSGCGGWCFTDATAGTGLNINIYDMGLAVGDLNNDGYWDIYNSNIGNNILLKGLPGGLYTDVSAIAGVQRGYFGQWYSTTWGMDAIDYDNDKYQDLYLVAGYIEGRDTGTWGPFIEDEAYLEPNALFHNRGGAQVGIFDDVSIYSGIDNELKGRTAAYADYNKDGAVDLYLQNFGEPSFLFQNTIHTGNWLQIELVGRGSVPRDPAGTIVKIKTSDGVTQMRNVQIGTGLGNGMDPAVYFGLGTSTRIDQIVITWPDGRTNVVNNYAGINRRLRVTKPGGANDALQIEDLSASTN